MLLGIYPLHLGCFHDLPTVNDVMMNLEDVSLRFNINQGKKIERTNSKLIRNERGDLKTNATELFF